MLHYTFICAHVAQLAEHVLGKDGVTGSNPVMGSSCDIMGGDVFRKDVLRIDSRRCFLDGEAFAWVLDDSVGG